VRHTQERGSEKAGVGRGSWLALAAIVTAAALAALALAPARALGNGLVDHPLCTADGAQAEPVAHGDRVVWVDYRSDPLGDIWMYDFATGEESQITDDPSEQNDPDLWGDWVVYYDYRNDNGDIYAKNVVTGEERAVCTDPGIQQRPKICDDMIVWEDYRRGQWDIGRARISTGFEGLWDFNNGDDRSPDVYFDVTGHGYVVAFEYHYEYRAGLLVLKADSAETRFPMEDAYGATLVAGDDEFVCGRFEDRGAGTHLYLYRYSWGNDSVTEITTDYEPYAEFRSLSVSGTKVAYAYDTDSGFRVRVHDWAQGAEAAVTSTESGQYSPAISGDMVVWRDDRNYPGSGTNYYDLYTTRGALPVPAIVTTSASTTLKAYGDAYTLTGGLEHEGTGLEGKTVVLQTATRATGPFADTAVTATTAADGTFSLTHAPASKTYYRASFAGDAGYDAATGSVVYTLPRAFVGNPRAAAVMYVGKAKTVYGYLKPAHKAGTYPVRIYKWRSVGGKWKAYGYVKAKASAYSGYTKYTKSLSLPAKGKWRLRVYHPADAGHAASWSKGYDYVTVR